MSLGARRRSNDLYTCYIGWRFCAKNKIGNVLNNNIIFLGSCRKKTMINYWW